MRGFRETAEARCAANLITLYLINIAGATAVACSRAVSRTDAASVLLLSSVHAADHADRIESSTVHAYSLGQAVT
jgi:hypothetical protein